MDPQPTSRSCFLCGRDNPVSLHVRWFNDPDAREIVADVTIPDEYNSYPGVVHGGIVAALLDETAGRAVMVDGDGDRLMVSIKLEVEYRRITPTGVPLRLIGRVVRDGGSRAQVASELRLADGTVTARATALLVRPPAEVTDRWEAERPFWHTDDPA